MTTAILTQDALVGVFFLLIAIVLFSAASAYTNPPLPRRPKTEKGHPRHSSPPLTTAPKKTARIQQSTAAESPATTAEHSATTIAPTSPARPKPATSAIASSEGPPSRPAHRVLKEGQDVDRQTHEINENGLGIFNRGEKRAQRILNLIAERLAIAKRSGFVPSGSLLGFAPWNDHVPQQLYVDSSIEIAKVFAVTPSRGDVAETTFRVTDVARVEIEAKPKADIDAPSTSDLHRAADLVYGTVGKITVGVLDEFLSPLKSPELIKFLFRAIFHLKSKRKAWYVFLDSGIMVQKGHRGRGELEEFMGRVAPEQARCREFLRKHFPRVANIK